MKIAVVGGVFSTEVLLHALVDHGLNQVHVWGYEPHDTSFVSGWRNLHSVAQKFELGYEGFRKVTECEAALRAFEPDVVFYVGLSQIVPPSMLCIAKKVNVGFHPTALPRGRGRAALAWLILQQENGAASFFELRDGVDDGPIFVQEPFIVSGADDASDVEERLLRAERVALDRWLPQLAVGTITASEQDHSRATWLGRRTPDDGWLDWKVSRNELLKLVRASAPPHPGAYTFCQDHKILVLKAQCSERRENGVLGRILSVHADGSYEVQALDGIINVTQWRSDTGWVPKVGLKLGYYAESEVFQLRSRVAELEYTVANLHAMINEQRD